MFKLQEKPDSFIKTDTFRILKPIVTMVSDWGMRMHIVNDGGVYVIYSHEDHRDYHICPFICHDIHEVLKTLPSPLIKKC